MQLRDILLGVLILFNILLAINVTSGKKSETGASRAKQLIIAEDLASTKEVKKVLVAQTTTPDYFKHYATLDLIKRLIPSDVFAKEILPLAEEALENASRSKIVGKISDEDWKKIEEAVLSLRYSYKIDFNTLFIEDLSKKELKGTIDSFLNEMRNEASGFSNELKNELKTFFGGHKEYSKLNKLDRPCEEMEKDCTYYTPCESNL